jgi:anhydro-N-acetylmuramic acid kinase
MSSERLIVGAMSGTSGDGVDAALVRIKGSGLDMTATHISHQQMAFDSSVKSILFAMRESGNCRLSDLAKLGREISLVYVETVRRLLEKTDTKAAELQCVAAHGQTLYHDPPNTIQYFDPSLAAYELGCPVVSDFRRADLAAGGQGAPLVPFADYILFRHPEKNRVLLNIGGIANITWLKAGGTLEDVIAFDTGPGNCISDYVCRQHDPSGPGYDVGGQFARQVLPNREALFHYLASEYVRRKPPKSTDGPAMIELFESHRAMRNAPFLERVATATTFATTSIHFAMEAMLPGKPDEVIVSGGGTQNIVMMANMLSQNKDRLWGSDKFGVPSEAKEAIAFAILGAATMDGFPSNVPSVTGARRPVVLGSVTPKTPMK